MNKVLRFIENSWYQKPSWLNIALLPVSYVFLVLVVFRRSLYRLGLLPTFKFFVPIIVVGNITVGGTGKTPFVVWLAELLKARGLKPGIVSKGYSGIVHRHPLSVTVNSDPFTVGDEAVLLARKTNCPVVVAKNRPAGVKHLIDTFHVNIVISDDGLQHYALSRDVEIVLMDGVRRLGNGYCLPAGPLREPQVRLRQADFIIVTEGVPQVGEYEMQLEATTMVQLINPLNHRTVNEFSHKKYYAVAGIGHPGRFFSTLQQMNLQCDCHSFYDHYPFQLSDFNFAEPDSIILMTEKDAVKCQQFADERFWYLPIQAKMKGDFISKLSDKISQII